MAFSQCTTRAVPACHGKLTAALLLSFERGKNRYKAGTRGVICAFIGWSSAKSTDNAIQSLAETSRYCCTDATSNTSKATMQGSAMRLGKAALTQGSTWATNRTLMGTSCLHLSFLYLRKGTDWDHTDKSPFISMSVTVPTHTAQGSIQSRHRRLRKTSLLPYSFAAACFCKLHIPFPASSKCL